MKKSYLWLSFLLVFMLFCGIANAGDVIKYETLTAKDKTGHTYQYVTNDPLGVRIYTLHNGLKVYLSVNRDKPRIQTLIAVKAGAKFDPAQTTGLAHYLEHMMFKGTDKIGTSDWAKEKVLLDKIANLYEKHRMEKDPAKKEKIYAEIDRVSQEASKYAIPSEYDKMLKSLGAQGTNAYTSEERTVYVNDIPANALNKWAAVEKERFSKVVLRLFHTELETVYEEFNMNQDNDGFRAYKAMMEGLFQKHPYGTQMVIGKPEQLKNPSMVNIYKYWNTYYAPNNMAICMSGDLDYEKTIVLLDKTFGILKPNKKLPVYHPPVEKEITKPIVKKVYGPNAESVSIGFRLPGYKAKETKYLALISEILSNGKVGLIDLDLNQKQKVLGAGAWMDTMNDYSIFVLGGQPREGQSLDEVKKLVLGEIEKIKRGEFDDWLVPAIVNNHKLSELRKMDTNERADDFVDAFIHEEKWADYIGEEDKLGKVTKKELIAFAKKYLKNNYVVVYKYRGEDKNIVKVPKPTITPIDMNRTTESKFYQNFMAMHEDRLSPEFVDFAKEIKKDDLKKGVEFDYIKNKTNKLFTLNYIIDVGSNDDKKLALAVDYIQYLGTSKYSPAALQKEFYKLGLDIGVSTDEDKSYIYVSGIDSSYEKGVQLLEHVIKEVKEDDTVYQNLVASILKGRNDAKLDNNTILWGAMFSYARYGNKSPFADVIPENKLREIKPAELTNLVKNMTSYSHRIFYYGPRDYAKAKAVVTKYHKLPAEVKDYVKAEKYKELDTTEQKVYFVNYDTTQASILFVSKGESFNKEIIPQAKVYNEFYGMGLSSIVFQEIREAKGLAYTAFSAFSMPRIPTESHYIYNFVGTQPDKIKDAIGSMLKLTEEMPDAQKQFELSKDAVLKNIEAERTTKESIFWTYRTLQELGLGNDYKQKTYEKIKTLDMASMKDFFNNHIKGRKYTILVIGNKNDIDMNMLAQFGKVQELTLEELFGY